MSFIFEKCHLVDGRCLKITPSLHLEEKIVTVFGSDDNLALPKKQIKRELQLLSQ